MQRLWKHYNKKYDSADATGKTALAFEQAWLSNLIKDYFAVLSSASNDDTESVLYCERFLELLCDLEAQMPTRRFVNALLADHKVSVISAMLPLAQAPQEFQLYNQLLEQAGQLLDFEIDDRTGAALAETDMMDVQCRKIANLQNIAFSYFKDTLKPLALASMRSIENPEMLMEHLEPLDDATLMRLCEHLHIRTTQLGKKEENYERQVLLASIVREFKAKKRQIDAINAVSLFPNETDLFDNAVISDTDYDGRRPLALPKLSVQFLTTFDYLLRNFKLFRLESTFDIRQDIEDAVRRLAPAPTRDGRVTVRGWARMAVPIKSFTIVDVAKPKLGETKPSQVRADVTFDIGRYIESIRDEWDALRPHDCVFLLSLVPSAVDPNAGNVPFRPKYGLQYVRGAEIQCAIGPNGKLRGVVFEVQYVDRFLFTGKPLDDLTRNNEEESKQPQSTSRHLRLLIDPNQYHVRLCDQQQD